MPRQLGSLVKSVSSAMPLLISVRVLKDGGGPSYSYKKYGHALTDRVALDRDKELTLSPHHVSCVKGNGNFRWDAPFLPTIGCQGKA